MEEVEGIGGSSSVNKTGKAGGFSRKSKKPKKRIGRRVGDPLSLASAGEVEVEGCSLPGAGLSSSFSLSLHPDSG